MQVILLRRSIVLKNCNKTSQNIKDQLLVLVTQGGQLVEVKLIGMLILILMKNIESL